MQRSGCRWRSRAGAHIVANPSPPHVTPCTGRPSGAKPDWRELSAQAGGAAWVRRGEVLAVARPGNAPGVHRSGRRHGAGLPGGDPSSRREPFTAHRLVPRLCGRRVFGPATRCTADRPRRRRRRLQAADLAIVYGGQDVAESTHRSAVLTNGPGRPDPDQPGVRLARVPRRDRRSCQPGRDGVRQRHRRCCTRPMPRAGARPSPSVVDDRAVPTRRTRVLPTTPSTRRGLSLTSRRKAAGAVLFLGADQVVATSAAGRRPSPRRHLLPDRPGQVSTWNCPSRVSGSRVSTGGRVLRCETHSVNVITSDDALSTRW